MTLPALLDQLTRTSAQFFRSRLTPLTNPLLFQSHSPFCLQYETVTFPMLRRLNSCNELSLSYRAGTTTHPERIIFSVAGLFYFRIIISIQSDCERREATLFVERDVQVSAPDGEIVIVERKSDAGVLDVQKTFGIESE